MKEILETPDLDEKRRNSNMNLVELLSQKVIGHPAPSSTSFGPLYAGMILEGRQIRVRLRYADSGLESRGDRIEGFAIAGRDRKFVWADARIEGGTLAVSANSIPDPVAVRYG